MKSLMLSDRNRLCVRRPSHFDEARNDRIAFSQTDHQAIVFQFDLISPATADVVPIWYDSMWYSPLAYSTHHHPSSCRSSIGCATAAT